MTFEVEKFLWKKRNDVIFQIFGDPSSCVRSHREAQQRRQIASANTLRITLLDAVCEVRRIAAVDSICGKKKTGQPKKTDSFSAGFLENKASSTSLLCV